MHPTTAHFITRWKTIVAERDMQGLFDILMPDVVFYSPAVFKPYQGREAATFLLANVIQVFGELTYTDVFTSERVGVVLQFTTAIDTPDKTMQIEGVDIFQLTDEGLVQEMRVMIRPLSALQALATAMQERMTGP